MTNKKIINTIDNEKGEFIPKRENQFPMPEFSRFDKENDFTALEIKAAEQDDFILKSVMNKSIALGDTG